MKIALLIILGTSVLPRMNKPLLCAVIYTLVSSLWSLLWKYPFPDIIILPAVGFVLSAVYFWLLDRYEDSAIIWWLVLLMAFMIGLV